MRRVKNNKDNRRFENKMLGGKEKKSSIYIEEGDGAVHSFLYSVKATTFQEGIHRAGVSA